MSQNWGTKKNGWFTVNMYSSSVLDLKILDPYPLEAVIRLHVHPDPMNLHNFKGSQFWNMPMHIPCHSPQRSITSPSGSSQKVSPQQTKNTPSCYSSPPIFILLGFCCPFPNNPPVAAPVQELRKVEFGALHPIVRPAAQTQILEAVAGVNSEYIHKFF